MDRYYTIKQMANFLHVDPVTIRRSIKSGRLPATLVANKYLISSKAMWLFVNSRPVKATKDQRGRGATLVD
jgi:excisionase family DNA binding protein